MLYNVNVEKLGQWTFLTIHDTTTKIQPTSIHHNLWFSIIIVTGSWLRRFYWKIVATRESSSFAKLDYTFPIAMLEIVDVSCVDFQRNIMCIGHNSVIV